MKTKLAIIGLGKFGQKYVETIQKDFSDEIELVAACRKKPYPVDFLPKNCPLYLDWKMMCWDVKFDGLIVATNPNHHYEVARYACTNRIPIMIEKPAVLKSDQVNDLLKINEQHYNQNPFILVNYVHLFSPAFIELQRIIKNHNIQHIITKGYNCGPNRDFSSLWDYSTHDLSMIFSIINDLPTHITCKKEITNVGELFNIMMFFGSKKPYSYSITGNGGTTKQRMLQVSANLGKDIFNYDGTLLEHQISHKSRVENHIKTILPSYYSSNPLNNSISHFLKLIDGTADSKDIRYGLQLTSKITAILEECERRAL